MISPDAYADLCDLVIDPAFNPELVIPDKPIRRVFVTAEKNTFEKHLRFLRSLPDKPELIYARSDQQFTRQMFWSVKEHVSHVYAVNCEFQHPMLTQIPLGVACPSALPARNAEKSVLCYMNFNSAEPSYESHASYKYLRQDCARHFPWVKTDSPELMQSAYYKRLLASAFVICPFGFGIDTYRFYESVWCGARPVVITSGLDPLYKKFGAVIVNDWSEVTEEFLKEKLKEVPEVDSSIFDVKSHIPHSQ